MLPGLIALREGLEVGQVLVPGRLLRYVGLTGLLLEIVIGVHHAHGGHVGQHQWRLVGDVAERAHGRVVGAHAGAGVDQQVPTDGARVGDLTLAYRGRAAAGSGLTEATDLVHDATQIAGLLLVQAGNHGQRDARGRDGYIGWGIGVVQHGPGHDISGGREADARSLRYGLRETVRHFGQAVMVLRGDLLLHEDVLMVEGVLRHGLLATSQAGMNGLLMTQALLL